MMKTRLFFFTLLISAFALNLAAKEVSLADAEKAAKNFIYITLNKYGQGTTPDEIRLSDPYVYEVDGQAAFYAFDLNPGFVIISGDDAFTPVIGYSFEGEFVFDEAIPNYKGFLLNYVGQIQYIRDNKLDADPEFTALWSEIMVDDITAVPVTRERDVEPLLQSTWDQGSPYNLLCPEDSQGPGGHTWVGCVATAMAQIMYYWRYPANGTDDHCYTPSMIYGPQCADFENTYYQWEGMINSIDNKNPIPNAELQYHCAVSVNMNFGPDGSGSQSYIVPNRLDQFWRYNDAEYLEKNNYSNTTWINMLKDEIDAAHPLYYSGYSAQGGGHAFVCDGYQGNNFHFNFGWSGSGNGYYSLSDVGGYYLGQGMVRYFVPTDPAYPYRNMGDIIITHKSGSFADGSGPAEDYDNNTDATWLIDPQTVEDSITNISVEFTMFDLLAGDSVLVYDGGTTSDPLLGAFSGSDLPDEITSSSNKMLIRFVTDGSGTAAGWYAEFSTTSPTWCSGLTEFTEPSGTFNDGSGSFFYQAGATCMWRIKPDYANKITLYFDSFETEAGKDLVKVYDNSTLIGTFSGDNLPEAVEATSGTMFITWTTNGTVNMQGWEAYYEVDNVGIQEGSEITALETYPNPAGNQLNVIIEMNDSQQYTIALYNLAGQQVYEETGSGNGSPYQSMINTSNLKSGLYFLRVNSASGSWNKKIIVAH
jgi:hypothetical protein